MRSIDAPAYCRAVAGGKQVRCILLKGSMRGVGESILSTYLGKVSDARHSLLSPQSSTIIPILKVNALLFGKLQSVRRTCCRIL
jgi:hypothetical protein